MTSFSQPLYGVSHSVFRYRSCCGIKTFHFEHNRFIEQTFHSRYFFNQMFTLEFMLTHFHFGFTILFWFLCWDFHHDCITVSESKVILSYFNIEYIFHLVHWFGFSLSFLIFILFLTFTQTTTTTITISYQTAIVVGYFDWQNISNSQTHLTWHHPIAVDTILIYPNYSASTYSKYASIYFRLVQLHSETHLVYIHSVRGMR